MWGRGTVMAVPGVVLLGVVALAAPAGAAAEAPGRAPAGGLRAEGGAYDVTLPTGDIVHVAGAGTSVTPAPGRDPAFTVSHDNGDLYVVPDDRLSDDPERYNVTALHEGRRPVARPKASGELVTVRVRSIARDGRPGLGVANFLNVEDGAGGNARRPLPGTKDQPCTDASWEDADCIRLRPGTYSILGLIKTLPSWAPSTSGATPLNYSLVGSPEVEITGDTEIVLDARKATEVTVATPEHATAANPGTISHLMWTRSAADGTAVDDGVLMPPGATLEERLFLQPTARVRRGSFEMYTRWRLEAPAITMRAAGVALAPRYYDAAYFSDVSSQFPRLDGRAVLRVADGDRPGADLRGRLALVQRKDGVPVAEQSNAAAKAGARMVAVYNDRPGVDDETGGAGVQLRVPTVRLSHEEGRALLRRSGAVVTAKGVVDSPYLYDLVFPETGQIPKKLHYIARTRDLARVENSYSGADSVTTGRYSRRPWEEYATAYTFPLIGAPRTRVEYLSADPGTQWSARAATPEEPYNHAFPGPETPFLRLDEAKWTSYKPGARASHAWFQAPLTGGVNPLSPISRTGDRIRLRVGLVDAAANYSDAYSSLFPGGFVTDFRVYRDDELVAQTAYLPNGTLTTTPGEATYRVQYDVANNATWARSSTRTKTAWTFRSAQTQATTTLLLLQVGYDARVDLHNRARSGVLKLTVRHQDGSRTPLKRLTLAASFDDGTTWTAVPVKDGTARLHGRGMVSLRVAAEDAASNTIDQEVIRAYELH
ncbi:PA domain-containing protein [Actinomadura fibrosa]|uniref:PA domain-containing protein n=1 Tax=Actinomadura fibrosa TaxID=111802 RepID=A0ABW2XPG3_9ACTN|nr:PA domain-containing protein [Actinomadura fibrosa]